MKKLIFTLSLALAAVTGANAQLAAGSIAPNWTFKDLNGNSHTLYNYLAQGKTVFIDVSAAWCAPCWAYHNSGNLENLFIQHGPTGMANVSASTTNDVMVFFIEGESTNTTAQLYGTTSGTGHATFSQGNWVTGTPYPIIDTNAAATTAFDQAYQIAYFPTIYMICRDHIIREVGQVTTAELYAASQADCPTYAPSTTVDAKAVPYTGANYFVCSAAPSVKFQNYSATNNITAATIKVYSGSTMVTSYNWTGNLAPYDVATVNIPAFTAPNFMPYKYDVTVTGDSYAANNVSSDSLFKVFLASNAAALPYTQNFDGLTDFPVHMGAPSDGNMFIAGSGVTGFVGPNGQSGDAVVVNFFNMAAASTTELLIGNFNSSASANVAIDFDVAYAQYAGTENDKLEILASKDCGVTWTSVWSKSGATLKTAPAIAGEFIPTAASMWRHESALLTTYKDVNMLVKIKGTSDYGNYSWIDNVKITSTTGVPVVATQNSFSVYPNPAKDNATVEFTLATAGNVQIQVLDATGRVISNISNDKFDAGVNKVNVNTANMAAGLYNVRIQTENGIRVERLSVIK